MRHLALRAFPSSGFAGRWAPIALVAFGAAFALAGCGGSSTVALEPVAKAAERTQKAGSSRVAFTITMTGLTPKPLAIRGGGAFDIDSRRGRMSFDFSALADQLGQDLGDVEAIFDGTTYYMRLPFLSSGRPALKPWLRFDLDELGREQGLDLQQLTQLGQGDPTQALTYLRGAGDFERVGTELVRGVETTRYRGTIDLREAAERLSGEQRHALEQAVKASGIDEVPAEAWIDADGLLRRLELEYAKIPGQERGSMTITLDLYDFGTHVDVELPPDDQVTDVSELTRGS